MNSYPLQPVVSCQKTFHEFISSERLNLLQHHSFSTEKGFTLIEMIMSMLIISIALIGIFSVMNMTVSRSADPMIQNQAVVIAESYLEEILLMDFCDDPADTVNCPLASGSETGETRSTFDDVDDYNGLSDSGATDQSGTVITGLSEYNVTVSVTVVTITGVAAKEIKVTVAHSAIGNVDLVGYKTDY